MVVSSISLSGHADIGNNTLKNNTLKNNTLNNNKISVVCMGDSITYGFCGNGTSYPSILQSRLSGAVIHNAGECGDQTYEMLARFDRDVISHHPNFVIIMGGINDLLLGQPEQVIEDDLAVMCKNSIQNGITPVLCSITPMTYVPRNLKIKTNNLNKWILSYSNVQGYKVIDFNSVLGDDHDNLRQEYDSGDGCHPNAAGYVAMGNSIDINLFKH